MEDIYTLVQAFNLSSANNRLSIQHVPHWLESFETHNKELEQASLAAAGILCEPVACSNTVR